MRSQVVEAEMVVWVDGVDDGWGFVEVDADVDAEVDVVDGARVARVN
jgi:hypothetical protein